MFANFGNMHYVASVCVCVCVCVCGMRACVCVCGIHACVCICVFMYVRSYIQLYVGHNTYA